jgi:hypothetical protein
LARTQAKSREDFSTHLIPNPKLWGNLFVMPWNGQPSARVISSPTKKLHFNVSNNNSFRAL